MLGSAACIIDIDGAKLRKRSRVGRLDAVLCALAPGALLTLLKRPADLTGKKGPTGALVAESSLFLNGASPSATVWSGKESRRATFAGAVQRYLTLVRVNDVLATHRTDTKQGVLARQINFGDDVENVNLAASLERLKYLRKDSSCAQEDWYLSKKGKEWVERHR